MGRLSTCSVIMTTRSGKISWRNTNLLPALSFGVAGSGSGVPFHTHGPGFSETVYGRKRWFLTAPEEQPLFHPNRTTLQWLLEDYQTVKQESKLYECTLRPGEAIYFPHGWWHAT